MVERVTKSKLHLKEGQAQFTSICEKQHLIQKRKRSMVIFFGGGGGAPPIGGAFAAL